VRGGGGDVYAGPAIDDRPRLISLPDVGVTRDDDGDDGDVFFACPVFE
jgi:hypothetical protein